VLRVRIIKNNKFDEVWIFTIDFGIILPPNLIKLIIFGGKFDSFTVKESRKFKLNPNLLVNIKRKIILIHLNRTTKKKKDDVRMVDFDQVKPKLGAIFGLIGSVILLIVGLSSMTMNQYYVSYGDVPIFIPYITSIVTSAVSALGMFGAVLVIRDDFKGYTFLLLAGIIGIIGTFIPIYVYIDEWDWAYTFYLSSSAGFFDLVLMLVGGILGFALAEKEERKE